jgi:hypothetical protein
MKESDMKRPKWVPWLPVLGGLLVLVLFSCDWENNAEDNPEYVSPNASMTYELWDKVADSPTGRPVAVSGVCCEQDPAQYTNDGTRDWAIDGAGHWWHTRYGADASAPAGSPPSSMTLTGHLTDTTLVADKDANMVETRTLVPENGAHWICFDLGEVVPDLSRLAYRGRTDGNGSGCIVMFEIYVSNEPIGWDVSDTGAVFKVSEGTWPGTANTFHYANFGRIAARYIQLRCVYSTPGTNNNIAVQEVQLETCDKDFPGLNASGLFDVYFQGLDVLENLDKDTVQYSLLAAQLASAKDVLLNIPQGSGDIAADMNAQTSIDTLVAGLQAVLDTLDPPRKPPVLEEE